VESATQAVAVATDDATWYRREEALAGLRLALCPGDGAAYLRRAWARERLGQGRDAAADYGRALATLPAEPAWRAGLLFRRAHNNYVGAGDARRAAVDLREVLRLTPDDADACNFLAWLLVSGPPDLRDPLTAVQLLRHATELAPTRWTYWNSLGMTYYRLGRHAEAVPAFERSLRYSGGKRAAHDLFPLAMCHARLGDPTRARDCMEQALRWCEEWGSQVGQHERRELSELRAEAESALAAAPKK
jgi:tetratricopeptide (TPR) repeat protein